MNNFQIVLIVGLAASFLISNLSTLWLRTASTNLEPEILRCVWRRENQTTIWWRLVQYGGMALVMGGFLLRNKLEDRWLLSVAAGIVMFCASSVLRAWLTRRAFNLEAPGTPACARADTSAVLVTVAELLLAGAVCWVVLEGQV